jgi:Cu-Zn family superoxide dismutase
VRLNMITGMRLVATTAVLFTVGIAAQQASTKVEIRDTRGQSLGTATLTAAGSGVRLALDVKGLTPGVHAVHFHQVPKCEGSDFTSAGPHLNPDGKKHGLDNPEGPHAGDMNNFTVGADGTSKATVTNQQATLGGGQNSVFANGGTALVIHAQPDDMKTDPAGNAGDRIGCGVITK